MWAVSVEESGSALRSRRTARELAAADGHKMREPAGSVETAAARATHRSEPSACGRGAASQRREPCIPATLGPRPRVPARTQGRLEAASGALLILLLLLPCSCNDAASGAATGADQRPRSALYAIATRPPSFEGADRADLRSLPRDVPSYPGALWYIGGTATSGAFSAGFIARQSPVEIYVYYRRALRALGWDLVEERSRNPERLTIEARKGARQLSFSVGTGPDGTELTITTGPTP